MSKSPELSLKKAEVHIKNFVKKLEKLMDEYRVEGMFIGATKEYIDEDDRKYHAGVGFVDLTKVEKLSQLAVMDKACREMNPLSVIKERGLEVLDDKVKDNDCDCEDCKEVRERQEKNKKKCKCKCRD